MFETRDENVSHHLFPSIEDVVNHAKRRKAFGKPLIDQPVVRYKIATMARQVEALTAYMEATVYQMSQMR